MRKTAVFLSITFTQPKAVTSTQERSKTENASMNWEQRNRKLAERKMRLAERREGAAVEGQGGVIEISAVMEEQPEGTEVDT